MPNKKRKHNRHQKTKTSQPKRTATTSASQLAGAKPAESETSSASPNKATPLTSTTGKAGAASTAGPVDVGAAKGKQEGSKPQDTAKGMPKSVPISSSKAESVDPTKPVVAAGAVAAGGVSASAGKAAVEGNMEVKSKNVPVASTKAVTTKPVVTKPSAEVDQRSQEVKLTKAAENPKKPLSTEAALDSLSAGFDNSGAPSKEKKKPVVEDIGAADALSAGVSNFSPAPPDSQATKKKVEDKKPTVGTVSKSEAPPADKKARVDKDAVDFSLKAGLAAPKPSGQKTTNEDTSMSADALSALEDLLPSAEPEPEPPKIQPKDIVKEDKLKSEKGVRVGEREDTIPPEYRFTDDKLKDFPAPKKEPSMDAGEALDILSGDFVSPVAAPEPPKQAKKDAPALDVLGEDFMVSAKAPSVQAPVLPLSQVPQDTSMSADALSALEDLLPSAEPEPEPPKIQPRDIVKEDKLKSEKGVRVGEREDTIPPEYRFTDDKLKDYPAPKKEPSMDAGEALDILSGDFVSPVAAPEPPKQAKKDAPAIDALAGDFVVSAQAPSVQAPVLPSSQVPQHKHPQPSSTSTVVGSKSEEDTSMSADALSALEDLLPSAEPEPEPPKIQPRDIVKEDKLKSEKGVRVGEREDTIPPEYRFTDDKLKDYPAPKKEPSMDDATALGLLSSDFGAPAASVVPTAPVSKAAPAAPAASVVPTAPVSKAAPAAPAASVVPTAPVSKAAPAAPAASVVPTAPVSKAAPAAPAAPAASVVPTAPVSKAAPAASAAPAAPPASMIPAAPISKPTSAAAVPKVTSTAAPAVQSSQTPKPKAHSVEPIHKPSLDFEDVVAPAVAPSVQAAAAHPLLAERQLSEGAAGALDALSDTLTDNTPAPVPTPVPAKDIVKEKKVTEEKAAKTGERDDSLPPEYRPSEKDVLAKKDVKHVAPKQPSMDDATALGLLSSDFGAPAASVVPTAPVSKAAPAAPAAPAASVVPTAPVSKAAPAAPAAPAASVVPTAPVSKAAPAAPAAPAASVVPTAPVSKGAPAAAVPKVTSTTTPAVQSSQTPKPKAHSVEPTHKETGAVMDALSSTLLPDVPAFKPKAVPTDEKAQATSSELKSKLKKQKVSDGTIPDDLSAQSKSDVVPSSGTKKGSKS